ncbi:MAG: hypothetical protein ACI9TA_003344 [Reinekea sp.]|jgi:hypothetical protein
MRIETSKHTLSGTADPYAKRSEGPQSALYLQNVHGAAYGQRILFTTTASGPDRTFVGRAVKVRSEPIL